MHPTRADYNSSLKIQTGRNRVLRVKHGIPRYARILTEELINVNPDLGVKLIKLSETGKMDLYIGQDQIAGKMRHSK